MSTAAKVAQYKQDKPELYCPAHPMLVAHRRRLLPAPQAHGDAMAACRLQVSGKGASVKNKKTLIVPLNFLFHSSDGELSSFELSRLADVANLRMQLVEVIEELVEQAAHASLAAYFRQIDRKALLDAINTTVDPIAIAKRAIRENSRTADEPKLPPLPLGNAHSAAALRYQGRNIADGKCSVCPSRLARHSVRYCEKHLKVFRDRAREKSKKLNKPPHGRAAGTLQALAETREHRRKKADE